MCKGGACAKAVHVQRRYMCKGGTCAKAVHAQGGTPIPGFLVDWLLRPKAARERRRRDDLKSAGKKSNVSFTFALGVAIHERVELLLKKTCKNPFFPHFQNDKFLYLYH